MAEKNRLSLYVDDDLAQWLDRRGQTMRGIERGGTRARTELALWRGHLAAELRATAWTLPELGCIADVLLGAMPDDAIGPRIAIEVSDAFESAPGVWAAKWGVDEAALLSKVRGLGPTASHALLDAMTRWWAEDAEHAAEAWRALGVRVAP